MNSNIANNRTHVCGCIRVNDPDPKKNSIPKLDRIKDVLGRIVEIHDLDWDTDVPCGTDGSLHYEIMERRRRDLSIEYVIPIYGDLKDYTDVDEVENWFRGVCEYLPVRQATLIVEADNTEPRVISYTMRK